MSRKVRAGARYQYRPVPLDQCHVCSKAEPGQVVRVVNLHGAPPANTMGHAHIESLSGEFLGMVHTNSLQPLKLFPTWYGRAKHGEVWTLTEWEDVKTAKGAMQRLQRLYPDATEWEVSRTQWEAV